MGWVVRIAAKTASFNGFFLRQKSRQGTRGSRLGCTAFAADEHAANARINRVEHQSTAHALLPDDSSKRINDSLIHQLLYLSAKFTTPREETSAGIYNLASCGEYLNR
jgi:hypothetical protein